MIGPAFECELKYKPSSTIKNSGTNLGSMQSHVKIQIITDVVVLVSSYTKMSLMSFESLYSTNLAGNLILLFDITVRFTVEILVR